jgi:hypothetical protein
MVASGEDRAADQPDAERYVDKVRRVEIVEGDGLSDVCDSFKSFIYLLALADVDELLQRRLYSYAVPKRVDITRGSRTDGYNLFGIQTRISVRNT